MKPLKLSEGWAESIFPVIIAKGEGIKSHYALFVSVTYIGLETSKCVRF